MINQTEIKTERLGFIDALRGIAVILMIEQHMGYWLWNMSVGTPDFFKYPVLITFNAMGGFAAPAFVTLAGTGSVFLALRHSLTDRALVIRGAGIIIFGYLLNIMVPSWFSIGSWYVLHMIGFGLILSVILRRIRFSGLLLLFIIVIAATVLIQNYLDTPKVLYNSRMRNYSLPGGMFRLALAESQFPVFPWLSFFIAGILSGRLLLDNKIKKILILAGSFFLTGVVLSIPGLLGLSIAKSGPLYRLFRLFLGFYPANPPIVLLLISLVLFSIVIFYKIDEKFKFKTDNFLVCLGRISLTLLIVHIVLFRQAGKNMGLWHRFSTGETLLIIFITLLIFSIISVFWRKSGYRFGAEWVIRKISN